MRSLVQERIVLRGRVQGVGMRPYIYRQATSLDICGDVRNTEDGVELRIQGSRDAIDALVAALRVNPPPHAVVRAIERTDLDKRPCGEGFCILSSTLSGTLSGTFSGTTAAIDTALPPDRATCANCLTELFDPANRRHRHPFISCTDCGPRHSMVSSLPWDRCRNTMASFPLCVRCRAEVDDPGDRRFHSQTNCCPDCGPRLSLSESGLDSIHEGASALDRAVELLAWGGLLAVKGLGGFHLMARADQPAGIERIRQLKRRQRKPLAVMFAQLESLAHYCRISEAEQEQLCSATAPIVLLQRRPQALFISPLVAPFISPLVAPGLDRLGAMLAYTPLHHLLLQSVGVPLIATSANRRDEPLCYRNEQAIDGFAGSVDAVLYHQRDIRHPLDDSIVQIAAGRPMTLRRARGFELQCAELDSKAVDSLAVGADLKNCIALNRGREILSAPHIGNLNSLAAEAAHGERGRDLCELYGLQPQRVVCDLHPAYSSRRLAIASGLPLHAIQHHRAHLYAVLAENPRVQRPLMAAIWDGTGYGDDGTVWGGEFFLLDKEGDRRLARLAPFHLPGGEQAIREPRRLAFSLLFALYGEGAIEHPALPHFAADEKRVLLQMLQQQINSPLCSSAGRLFDGVAALLGMHPWVDYEGEAAICLEQFAARSVDTLNDSANLSPYPIELDQSVSVWQLDWRPMLRQILEELATDRARTEQIAARFHGSLAHGILEVASAVGSADLLVGGGCFQNRLLLEAVRRLANERGIRLHWPRSLPPGDGAIAAGQLYALLLWGQV